MGHPASVGLGARLKSVEMENIAAIFWLFLLPFVLAGMICYRQSGLMTLSEVAAVIGTLPARGGGGTVPSVSRILTSAQGDDAAALGAGCLTHRRSDPVAHCPMHARLGCYRLGVSSLPRQMVL